MPEIAKLCIPNADLYDYANAPDWHENIDYTKKTNVIVLYDFIEFEYLYKQLDILVQHKDNKFIILTEHNLPDKFLDYENIFHINFPTPEEELLFTPSLPKTAKEFIHGWRNNNNSLTDDITQGFYNLRKTIVHDVRKENNNINNIFSITLGNSRDCLHKQRHLLYAHLKKQDLLKYCNYTIKKSILVSKDRTLVEAYNSIEEKIINDGNGIEYRYFHKDNLDFMYKHLNSAKLYIGLENKPFSIGGHLTEKSFYGYLFKKPTIHIYPKDSQKQMEKLGFIPTKNFTNDINNISNEEDKIVAICEELRYIANMSPHDLDNWITKQRDILEHNHEAVFKMYENVLNGWSETKAKLNKIELKIDV